VIQRGLGVLLLPVSTRILGVEQYGLAGTATALAALLAIFYGLGINFPIVRTYYDDDPEAPRTAWAALLRVQAVIAVLLAGLTYLTGPTWSRIFGEFGWEEPALRVAVLLALATALQTTAQGILRAARRPRAFVSVTLVQVVVGAALGLLLAVDFGAGGYVTGLAVGSLAATLISLGLSRRGPRWDFSAIVTGIRVGIPFMLHSLSTWGLDVSNRLFVALYLGVAAVGRLQVAYVMASVLTLLLQGIQSAWAPFFLGELSPEERRLTPPRMVVPVTTVLLGGTAILVLCAPVLLDILVPKSFGGTEFIIPLVASVSMARAAYLVAVVVLVDEKRSGIMSTASVAGALLNVGINVTLIPYAGLEAAALGTALGVMLQSIVVIANVGRRLDASMHLPRLLGLWLAGMGLLVLLSRLPETGWWLLIRGALVVCAGVFSVWEALRLRRALEAIRGQGAVMANGSRTANPATVGP